MISFSEIYNKRKHILVYLLNKSSNYFGYSFQQKGQGYFDAAVVVKNARKNKLTVCEYLESLGGADEGESGRRDFIIEALKPNLPHTIDRVLEIGTGTGMFMERIISIYHPKSYESYETNLGWVKYLKEEYGSLVNLINRNSTGFDLDSTPSDSIDVVFSHGVFVYLPLIKSIGYLDEMIRVCRPGGRIVFDGFLSNKLGLKSLYTFKNAQKYFPVIMPFDILDEYVRVNNMTLIHSFDVNYHESLSTYFILQKKLS